MGTLSDEQIQEHLNQLTKPPGSLGRLETLAATLCRIQGTLKPKTTARHIALFAGDHGVVASGVSAWPSEVTALMVANIAGGGAASNALASTSATQLSLTDVGCMGEAMESNGTFRNARIADGTKDLSIESAMTVEQFQAALVVGREEARRVADAGMRVIAAGEMGIGNTTPATCIAALLCDLDVIADDLVGAGAGADDAMVQHKRALIESAVQRVRTNHDMGDPSQRLGAVAAVGGYEIAAMAGFYAESAERGMVIVVDGLIATAGALIAEEIFPGAARHMIAAHESCEPAHINMLGRLELEPYLNWQLRLGEGTGALLMMPMLDAAAAMVGQMATFADLGIGPE